MSVAAIRTSTVGLVLVLILGALNFASAAAAQATLLLQTVGADGAVKSISLSDDDIAALPQFNLSTENEFVDGMAEFVGPLARDVIALMGNFHSQNVVLTAANDYFVEIPISDFQEYDVIFAHTMNGNRLSLRDKGPIWVIYPMSQNAELRDAVYDDRLIWQLVKVEIQ